MERQGQVVEVARLGVAPAQTRKDAEDLDVALNPNEIEPAQELAVRGTGLGAASRREQAITERAQP